MNRKIPTILIVDDSKFDYELVKSFLDKDYNVFYADNCMEALKMIERRNPMIHLVVLDLHMPQMDGFEFLCELRKNKMFDCVPVIATSADDSKESVLKALNLGAVDFLPKGFSKENIKKAVSDNLYLYGKEFRDNITGGYNRSGFIMEAESFLNNVKNKTDYALLYFNVRNFKAINEIIGVTGADLILKRIYDMLTSSSFNPHVAARLEADHFAILIDKNLVDINLLDNNLVGHFEYNDKTIQVFVRCGIFFIQEKEMNMTGIIDRAKLALESIIDEYAKPYAIYNSSMRLNYVDKAEVLSQFSKGIENEEFKVYYQPVIETKTGKLASCEALIRWLNPKKGLISPGIFIPALEKGGFISKLDNYVINHVYKTLEDRLALGKACVPVSINLSWMDFFDNELKDNIRQKMTNEELNKYIRYEVTETSFAALEQNDASVVLEKIRSCNMKILLDDFGSGYSSFGMIQNYDFDILKIDMSFIKKIDANPKVRVIIKSIIDMCHQIGVKTVAEGVETENQINYLKENNCDYIQGFYYSKPIPCEEFIEFLENYEKRGMIASYDNIDINLRSFYRLGVNYLSEADREKSIINSDKITKMISSNGAIGLISGYIDDKLTIAYVGDVLMNYLGGDVNDVKKTFASSLINMIHEDYRSKFDIYQDTVYTKFNDLNGSSFNVRLKIDITKAKNGEMLWLMAVKNLDIM